MIVKETILHGVYLIEPHIFSDERGWFTESYSYKKLEKFGINAVFIQDNHSYTSKKGTLRGLHCQLEPWTQSKLVRVLNGAVLDVVVDIRVGSPTYMSWLSVELSSENKKQLFIPKGFLHGFITLTDDVEFFYKCDSYYMPESDRSVRWNDPVFEINWGTDSPVLSKKDADAPYYEFSDIRFVFDL